MYRSTFPAVASKIISKFACFFKHFCYNKPIATTERKAVKASELKRLLAKQGAEFEEGKRHTKVTLNGKQTVLPRHPSKELKEGTRQAILKQLDIK